MLAPLLAAVALSAGVNIQCPAEQVYTQQATFYTGSANHGGFYLPSERTVTLAPAVCATLTWIATGHPLGPEAQNWGGYSIYVLAHELAHATGIMDETAADCVAFGTYSRVAAALGVARRAMVSMMVASVPFDGYAPAQTVGCWPSLMPRAA